MNKAIALAALTAIAFGNESFGENEFNVLKTVGNGLKKVGHFVEEHPQVITQGAKLLSHHDDEYFNIHDTIHKAEEGVHKAEHYVYDHRQQIKDGAKKGIDYVAEHPEVVNKAIEIVKAIKQHDDEELFNLKNTIHNVGHVAGTVGHIVKDGVNIYKDVKTGNIGGIIHDGSSLIHDIKHHDDEELFNLGGLIHDGVHIVKDVKTHNYGGLIHDGIQTVKDVKKHDDEYFSFGNAIHKIGDGVHKAEHYVYDHRQQIKDGAKKGLEYVAEHPEVVNKGVEIIKNLKHHDDEELFNLGGLINDGIHIVKDVKTHNYGGLVNDGIQTVKDVKQKKFLGH